MPGGLPVNLLAYGGLQGGVRPLSGAFQQLNPAQSGAIGTLGGVYEYSYF